MTSYGNHPSVPKATITISQSEYESLKRDALKLLALEQSGVDNWDWYGDAMDQFDEWMDLKEQGA